MEGVKRNQKNKKGGKSMGYRSRYRVGSYSRGKNWTSSRGRYYNGYGQRIRNPYSYFEAVGENRYGYNRSYRNGYGERIYNPSEYFRAVGEDRYGYNS